MSQNDDTQNIETTGDFIKQMLEDEEGGEAFARGYLKVGFLSSAVDALFYARRRGHLTQEQVAERLQTKQPAIARLEADTSGSISLKRYFEVALACDMVPLNIRLEPVEDVLAYLKANPGARPTPEAYDAWRAAFNLSTSLYASSVAESAIPLVIRFNAEPRQMLAEQEKARLELSGNVLSAVSGSGKTFSVFSALYLGLAQPLDNSAQPALYSSPGGVSSLEQSSGATLSAGRSGVKNLQEMAA